MLANQEIESRAAAEAFCRSLARELSPGLILGLRGELGAGKTEFVRFIAAYFGITHVNSPTYTLEHLYTCVDVHRGIRHVSHWDLYRLSEDDECLEQVLDYGQSNDTIVCVEWPDRLPKLLPSLDYLIQIDFLDSEDSEKRSVQLIRAPALT